MDYTPISFREGLEWATLALLLGGLIVVMMKVIL